MIGNHTILSLIFCSWIKLECELPSNLCAARALRLRLILFSGTTVLLLWLLTYHNSQKVAILSRAQSIHFLMLLCGLVLALPPRSRMTCLHWFKTEWLIEWISQSRSNSQVLSRCGPEHVR